MWFGSKRIGELVHKQHARIQALQDALTWHADKFDALVEQHNLVIQAINDLIVRVNTLEHPAAPITGAIAALARQRYTPAQEQLLADIATSEHATVQTATFRTLGTAVLPKAGKQTRVLQAVK